MAAPRSAVQGTVVNTVWKIDITIALIILLACFAVLFSIAWTGITKGRAPSASPKPIPDGPEKQQWIARFRARIVHRLTAGGMYTVEDAAAAADAELDALDEDFMTDDPEISADECLSYWENDEHA